MQVKLISLYAQMPKRTTPESAGMDIHCIETGTLKPGDRALISTGLTIIPPKGTYVRIAPRSGLAWKNGIHVGAGVIDGDYRGEVKVLIFNMGDTNYKYNMGDRIAQVILEKIELCECIEVDLLNESERGDGGFGSTGS